MDGGVIDPKTLVSAMDNQVLHIATKDIINAVYEVLNNPELVKPGKGMSNEFLQQAAEFVAAAKKKDPSIEVPLDFDQVVSEVASQIEEHLNSSANPNPENTISNGVRLPNENNPVAGLPNQNSSNPSTGPIGSSTGLSQGGSSGSGGSGSGGKGGGGGGGSGSGSSQDVIDTVTVAPIGNGDFSRVTVKGIGTSFTTKLLIVHIDEKQWGDVPFSVGALRTVSNTELNFEVSTPDDGRYKLEFVYDGKPLSYFVSFINGPSGIDSATVTAKETGERIGSLQGRNLLLSNNSTALSISGGPEQQSFAIRDFTITSNNRLSFTIPEKAAEGTYALTLQANGKTFTYPDLLVPLRIVLVDAVQMDTTDIGRNITVSGKETHFKRNETSVIVVNDSGKEVYRASGSQITVVSATELRFQLPAAVVGNVTVKIMTKHEEGRGTLELPKVVKLTLDDKSDPVFVGQTLQLKAIAKLSDKTTVDVTGKAAWTLSATENATISRDGLLTAVKAGTVVVTAGFERKTASQTVTIKSNVKALK